jgi:hypothetical protein
MPRPGKLSDADKRYIRKAMALREKLTDKALARRFGVVPRTIQYVNRPDPRKCKRRNVSRETSGLMNLLAMRK